MAGIGAEGAGGLAALQEMLRQRALDQIAAEQRAKADAQQQFQNSLETRRADEQSAVHQQTMQDHAAATTRAIQAERDTAAAHVPLSMNDTVDQPQFQRTFAGTASEPMFTPQISLAAKQTAGAMPLDPSQSAASMTTDAPQTATGRLVYTGTSKQREEADQNAAMDRLLASLPPGSPERKALEYEKASGKTAPAGMFGSRSPGELKETPGGFVRVGADDSVTPILQNGRPVMGRHDAPTVVIQTPTGPALVDKNKRTATPITDGASGEAVPPPPSAQERTRKSLATSVSSHFDDVQHELDDAERMGLLGPLKGRTVNEFLGGAIGSTGDPAKDELLGALRMDMSALSTGFASLHGRGGANAGMAKDLGSKLYQAKMSHSEIKGALGAMRKWVDSYAGKEPAAGNNQNQSGQPTAEELIKKYGG